MEGSGGLETQQRNGGILVIVTNYPNMCDKLVGERLGASKASRFHDITHTPLHSPPSFTRLDDLFNFQWRFLGSVRKWEIQRMLWIAEIGGSEGA